jgi:GntR family transcriptional regulator, transcriptional repressor for pyruvate dehydrogenase complex
MNRGLSDSFSPVHAESVVDAVLDQLIDQIRVGDLPNGTLLPGERQLAAAMRVSRRTIREAIEILQDAGVLSVTPGAGGGTRVVSPWIPDRLTADDEAPSVDEVFETLEARRVVEMRVAQLACVRATEHDLEIMRGTVELQRANRDDAWRVSQGNTIFHRQLWRACRNRHLESAMRPIYRTLSHAFFEAIEADRTSDSPDIAIELHEETLAAVASRDPDRMEAVFDRHLAYLEHRCESAYGRLRITPVPSFLLGRPSDTG